MKKLLLAALFLLGVSLPVAAQVVQVVDVDLPAISTFPVLPGGISGQGVQFCAHKPISGNNYTYSTIDGTTIGGTATSFTLTLKNETFCSYFDGNGDGNTPQWAPLFHYVPGFTGTQNILVGCTVMGGVPSGCTSTINTYNDGVLVSHTP